MNQHLDPTQAQFQPDDKQAEKAPRPKGLIDFTGQPKIVENLNFFIQAAKMREEALDHVLLHGPPLLTDFALTGLAQPVP